MTDKIRKIAFLMLGAAAVIGLIVAALVLLPRSGGKPVAKNGESSSPVIVAGGKARQWYPQISGDYVVYQDDRSGNWDVFLYDIKTKKRTAIADGPNVQEHPAVSGEFVVWQEDKGRGNLDIMLRDLRTGKTTAIQSDPAPAFNPQISGNNVVWIDERNGSWDIYAYDIAKKEEIVVSRSVSQELWPTIYKDRIAFVDIVRVEPTGLSGHWNILQYDLDKRQLSDLVDSEYRQFIPSAFGRKVAWHEDREGHWDIYTIDIPGGKVRRITDDPADQEYPAISDRFIAWQDNRSGNWDIYAYDMKTGKEYAVATTGADEEQPRINGNKLVWMSNAIDGSPNDGDVLMAILPDAGKAPAHGKEKPKVAPDPRTLKKGFSPTNPEYYKGPVRSDGELYQARCTLCHTLDRVTTRYNSPGFRSTSWRTIVERMRKHNVAPVTVEEQEKIIRYLERTYP